MTCSLQREPLETPVVACFVRKADTRKQIHDPEHTRSDRCQRDYAIDAALRLDESAADV